MGSIPSFQRLLKRQVETGGVALGEYWTAEEVESACRDQRHVWRDRFWTPLRTVCAFLLQVLHAGSSCREAVALTLGREAAAGSPCLPSDDPRPTAKHASVCRWRCCVPGSGKSVNTFGKRLPRRCAGAADDA